MSTGAAPEAADIGPLQHDEIIEVGSTSTDDDSAYGDVPSYTTSLASEVTNYRYENGRRYHSDRTGDYILPNDDRENDRLDMMHEMFKMRLEGKLFLAPIGEKPQRILDLGTGTGIWAIDIGDLYPSAQVIGNDLSPIQPTWVPPNVKFEIDNIEDSWTHEPNFDFIHCRWMAAGVQDWPRLVGQVYSHVKPGGWAEFQDLDIQFYSHDNTLKDDSALSTWLRQSEEAVKMIGRTLSPGPHLKGWIEGAGFVNVRHEVFKLPVGLWPKQKSLKNIGAFNWTQMNEGLEGMSLATYTRTLRWNKEKLLAFLTEVRKDLNNPNIHSLYDFHVVYAQRPESDEVTSEAP